MFELKEIPIEEITVPERARKEMGDIQSLADDIQRMGLIYPLILNDKYELCDGGRRLEALKHLNFNLAESRIIPGLSPDDSLIIEWLGNVSRKDFTWSEEVLLKLKIHEQCVSQDSSWGYRDTASKLGVALGGLSTDLKLAHAIRTVPEIASYKTKGKANEAYKKLVSQVEAQQAYESLSDADKQTLEKYFSTANDKAENSEESQENGSESESRAEGSASGVSVSLDGERSQDHGDSPKSSTSSLPKHVYEICDFRNILSRLPDSMVGFAELDPPYAIDFENIYGQSQDIETEFSDWTPEELYENMQELLSALYNKLADNSWILCWSGIEHWMAINAIAQSCGFRAQRPGFWVKPSGSTNNLQTNMISDYETYLLFRKGPAKFNTDHFKACKYHNSVPSAQKFHPHQKPISLYREFFRALSRPGMIFYSPFAGSGMSMITSTFFSMTPIGTDNNQKYYYEFIKWLKEYSYESAEQSEDSEELSAQLDSD